MYTKHLNSEQRRYVMNERFQEYMPKKGEYWYSIVSAKYDVENEDVKAIVGELKKLHKITETSLTILPDILKLPEVVNVGGREYKLDYDKNVDIKNYYFSR